MVRDAWWVLLLCTAAACADRPGLFVRDGEVDLSDKTSDFGTVVLSRSAEHTLTLRNLGEGTVTLGALSTSALGLGGGFAVVEGGTCTDGVVLPPTTGHCTLVVRFSPTQEGKAETTLTLAYTDDTVPTTTHGTLRGAGLLDCAIALDLQESRDAGATAAGTANQADAARGQAAGAALTYDDGYQGGYQAAYQSGYDGGYHDAGSGYPAGYADGYATGQAAGAADPGACASGQSDGAAAGLGEGQAAGEHDGYDAGYHDGYAEGDDGSRCTGAGLQEAPPPPRPKGAPARPQPASDPTLVKACYDKGYTTTRDTSAYDAAFAQAKLANAAYQAGLAAGGGDGFPKGHDAGVAQGHADGLAAGQTAGFADGQQARYEGCYDAAYGSAYDAAYQRGYGDGSGYDAGFADGEQDGYAAACG